MTQAPECRLVPVEPTDAMIRAAMTPRIKARDAGVNVRSSDIWRAMIAAAPHTAAPAADRAVLAQEAKRAVDDYIDAWLSAKADRGTSLGSAKASVVSAIDALARSTDAPSEPVAWQWRMNSISPWIDCAPGIVCRATPPAAATSNPCASGDAAFRKRFELVPVGDRPECCDFTSECCGNGACVWKDNVARAEASWRNLDALAATPTAGNTEEPGAR